MCVSDNANAEAWLRKRGAKNRMARRGLRLLRLLEARHGFQVTAASVWTKHNLCMGALSRDTPEEVRGETSWLGLARKDLRGPWTLLLDPERGAPDPPA